MRWFIATIWNSYSKSETARSPRMIIWALHCSAKCISRFVERSRLDLDPVGQFLGLVEHHLGALFQRKERPFTLVDGYADDQLVDQLHSPADDVEVAIGDRVERAGVRARSA